MDNKTPIQTPIRSAIQRLHYHKATAGNDSIDKAYIVGIDLAIKILTELQPAEKKLIEDTWKAGDNWCQINSMISIENRKISSEPDMQEYLKQFNY